MSTPTTLPAPDYQRLCAGLIGKSYADVDGCWGLVYTLLSLGGVDVPERMEDALAAPEAVGICLPAGESPRGGDIMVLTWPPEVGARQHVALCVSPFEVVHAWLDEPYARGGEVRRTPLSVMRRLGAACVFVRPKGSAN